MGRTARRLLRADPCHGLAGPSTNHVWNEQCAFPRARGEPEAIARTAAEAERRFANTWQTLEPLYSLADFCYVVRRQVVEAIGAADEGYSLGPCWEMDYNVRAARAGWQGVWASGAYVYRSPLTARRQREERVRFQSSKRRYQDKFCALRLLRQRVGYEAHCRGEACEHFAPSGQIQLRLPLVVGDAASTAVQSRPDAADKTDRPASGNLEIQEATPMVSCVKPTRDRADMALQAVCYFQRQDYPTRELIIVDDGEDNLERRLPMDPRIRYVRMPRGTSIGAKRDRACELARGNIVAHWDDDDCYSPERLSSQVAPLLGGRADITGLDAGVFFDLPRWEFWRCGPELHRRLFVEDVHGGTLVIIAARGSGALATLTVRLPRTPPFSGRRSGAGHACTRSKTEACSFTFGTSGIAGPFAAGSILTRAVGSALPSLLFLRPTALFTQRAGQSQAPRRW